MGPENYQMASVSGSQLTFQSPNQQPVNLILSNGKTVTGTTVAGAFNIEVFTVATAAPLPGVNATALIGGAVTVSGSAVRAATLGSIEQLGIGAYTLIDNTGQHSLSHHKASQGETIQLGTGAQSVIGSSGDTIVGGNAGTATQLIDLSGTNRLVTQGPMTATGGAGALLVNAGNDDSISGGSGSFTVSAASSDTIVGGSGTNFIEGGPTVGDNSIIGGTGTVTGAGGRAVNTLIVSDKGDTITGKGGSLSVEGGVGGATINVGIGGTTVDGGNSDVINNPGNGTLLVDINSRSASHKGSSITGSGSETINLGAGHGATTLRDVSVSGGTGPLAATTVTGFSTSTDVIASANSVAADRDFLGTSTISGGNTILTFRDGSTMTLVGITDIAKVTFSQ